MANRKQTKYFPKWLVLVGIIVLLVALLWKPYWNYYLSKTQPTQNTSQSQIPGWKVYDDQKWGFSFQYPSDWKFTEEDPVATVGLIGNVSGKNGQIVFGYDTSYKYSIIDDFYNSYKYEEMKGIKVKDKKYFYVDGFRAISFELDDDQGHFTRATEILKDSHIYKIDMESLGYDLIKNNLDTYNKLISTFKFTDLSNSITANPGEHCGGNIATAKQCVSGYHCQLEKIADLGGSCVKD